MPGLFAWWMRGVPAVHCALLCTNAAHTEGVVGAELILRIERPSRRGDIVRRSARLACAARLAGYNRVMPLEVRIKPVETLLFRGELVAVGKFRCPSTHPLFRDSGPCSHHTIVFPRTMTRIRHEDGSSFLGNPGSVALYNQDERYTRTKVSDVDASDWYTIADDVLLDMMRDLDPHATPERPFRIADGPSDARSLAEQRILFTA